MLILLVHGLNFEEQDSKGTSSFKITWIVVGIFKTFEPSGEDIQLPDWREVWVGGHSPLPDRPNIQLERHHSKVGSCASRPNETRLKKFFLVPLFCRLLLLLLRHFICVRLCVTPSTAAHQAPPSLGFSRQEHWSGLPFPSPVHESKKWKWSRSVVSHS